MCSKKLDNVRNLEENLKLFEKVFYSSSINYFFVNI